MRVFDAKCPDVKSENLRQLLDRLDHNGQLFKLYYLHVSHYDYTERNVQLTFPA